MAEALWIIDEICQATGGRSALDPAATVTGISIDTRTLQPGEAYIAIRGVAKDGHEFVPAAFEAGASCAIVAEDYEAADEAKLIRVKDPFEALQQLGRAARDRATETRIIAVTGSAGKTGTKEALRIALSPSGTVHASAKSYNNHWGVPLSLANMPKDVSFGIFEAGMNHAGELTPLSQMIRPHIAIVTTIAAVHLGQFPNLAAIADAKAEIFAGIEKDGTAILNRDNEFYGRLAEAAKTEGAKVVGFGEAEEADMRLVQADLDATGSQVTASYRGQTLRYRLGAPGLHLVQNSLAVLAAVDAAGADLVKAADVLSHVHAQAGRGAWHVFEGKTGKVAIIDEAYNANPASMRAALAILGLTPRSDYPRRIAVLGDMLELGEAAESFHTGLAPDIDAAGVDVVFACGPLMGALYRDLPPAKQGAYAAASGELALRVVQALQPGDVVMVKGSFGSKLGPLVEALQNHLKGGALD
ncbi:UDP-N-acetylmuramoylalanyl-D-glutamyl-2,6-diaminopimelate--D-alanyl-D-alanine ligase [Methyloligella sp. 2.7D]|uniref:UDP-N-acetylmuramoylalanyl-D-glutamyl-2, 6-diaminopimelate--D-alanyl-D-alanine ligase n=1 Tax=unclassified Methyloligella TaxID=2625955 RepID=UPI00157C2694|nr:UDP-N-acetylmuramoylalanyl-D-glutamyl-2,6-diaminopimelate--D-alanyl-D-alanine ligase [Methyloligella sp. GL2]QKP77995.1 UDP-N-acetylmuramoylalanyl-D-glutamyl-2,6-diaminopimelate--D-alanyl-D-alanine ligase [Methyloligella sp. GL2]